MKFSKINSQKEYIPLSPENNEQFHINFSTDFFVSRTVPSFPLAIEKTPLIEGFFPFLPKLSYLQLEYLINCPESYLVTEYFDFSTAIKEQHFPFANNDESIELDVSYFHEELNSIPEQSVKEVYPYLTLCDYYIFTDITEDQAIQLHHMVAKDLVLVPISIEQIHPQIYYYIDQLNCYFEIDDTDEEYDKSDYREEVYDAFEYLVQICLALIENKKKFYQYHDKYLEELNKGKSSSYYNAFCNIDKAKPIFALHEDVFNMMPASVVDLTENKTLLSLYDRTFSGSYVVGAIYLGCCYLTPDTLENPIYVATTSEQIKQTIDVYEALYT